MKNCLTIDIGGTKISSALFKDGTIIERLTIETPNSNGDMSILKKTLADLMLSYDNSIGFCSIATAGITRDGKVRSMSKSRLWGHEEFDLKGLVEKVLAVDSIIVNDAQAAAFCEYSHDNARLDSAFITVSTGVGAGIILDGKLLTGKAGLSGHIGHTSLGSNHSSIPCNCGRMGCVEAIASGTAIARLASHKLGTTLSTSDVFEMARNGNNVSIEIVNNSASAIANAIANLKATLDIERVYIGGSVGLADGYIPIIENELSKMPSNFTVEVLSANGGKDSGLLGAFYLAQQLLSRG